MISKLKAEYAKQLIKSGIKPYSVVRHSYTNNRLSGKKDIDTIQSVDTNLCPTLDTRCDCLAVVVEIEKMKRIQNEEIQCIDYRYDEGIRGRIDKGLCSTITTKTSGFSGCPMIMTNMLRIRKLTPKECINLMGFEDEDYKALKEIGMSDAAIYHMAGDSIVTTCLVSLLSPFVNDKNKHIDIVNNYVDKIVKN